MRVIWAGMLSALTKALHQGPWHNYQCKHGRSLGVGAAVLELGKILHFSHQKKFTLPDQFTFVAPRGLARSLEELIFNPDASKGQSSEHWNDSRNNDREGESKIPMDASLLAHIETFDFSRVDRRSLDDILTDPAAMPALAAMLAPTREVHPLA